MTTLRFRCGIITLILSLFATNVHAQRWMEKLGRGVVASHRLTVRGPGTVEIGDGVNLFSLSARTVLETRTREAVIRIGSGARVNETVIQASALVEVGPNCILGRAHIMDSDMHSMALDRRTNPEAWVRTAPIVLESNVWVGRAAAIPGRGPPG